MVDKRERDLLDEIIFNDNENAASALELARIAGLREMRRTRRTRFTVRFAAAAVILLAGYWLSQATTSVTNRKGSPGDVQPQLVEIFHTMPLPPRVRVHDQIAIKQIRIPPCELAMDTISNTSDALFESIHTGDIRLPFVREGKLERILGATSYGILSLPNGDYEVMVFDRHQTLTLSTR